MITEKNQYIDKRPLAQRLVSINWVDWLAVGETISSSTWAVAARDDDTELTLDNSSNTTTTATVRVSGGTPNRTYEIINTIITTQGSTELGSLFIRVLDH